MLPTHLYSILFYSILDKILILGSLFNLLLYYMTPVSIIPSF